MTQFLKPTKPSGLPTSDKSEIEAPALSKSVMSMKFMKRKEDEKNQAQDQRAQLQKLQIGDWSSSALNDDKPSGGEGALKFVRDYTDLYAALPGRRSFNGCNKAVEKHYYSIVSDKYEQKKQKDANKETIDDEEMVQRYQELVSLPRGPGQGKKPSHNQSRHNNMDSKDKSKKRKQEGDEFVKLGQGPTGMHGNKKKQRKQ
ncbi:hypothetical protein EON65_26755 [archaeon]|nr:MAG: hypothetical protein EON65_26755 [archaeon]